MSRYCFLVDYKYCSGCHACEAACNQEYDRPTGLSGIKVYESVIKNGEKFHIDYMPLKTDLCSFCAGRIKKGKQPSCVQHCLAGCLKVIETAVIADHVNEKSKIMLFT